MSNSCEGKVASDECLLALKEFENGKSPGSDGFTAEFYKFVWKELSETLTSNLNHAFEKGELSICQRRGIISLLPKKSKNTNNLNNLRPISLLNTDYKIATKSWQEDWKGSFFSLLTQLNPGISKGDIEVKT